MLLATLSIGPFAGQCAVATLEGIAWLQATAAGTFTLFSEHAGLVIERDSGEGSTARHKKVYRVDFDRVDADGFLHKLEVADLMAIQRPG